MITECISRIAVVVICIGDEERMKPEPVMKEMAEGPVYKLIASPAAVISEGHASGGHASCAEA